MQLRPSKIRVLQVVTFAAIMYAAIQLAIYLGVEEKSWFQRWWELATGGSVGLLAGIAFFFIVGAIGWVSGPIYGAIGLLGLATGGALGGLGLGALANVFRNPEKYNISVSTVLVTLIAGAVLASWLARVVGRRLAQVNDVPK